MPRPEPPLKKEQYEEYQLKFDSLMQTADSLINKYSQFSRDNVLKFKNNWTKIKADITNGGKSLDEITALQEFKEIIVNADLMALLLSQASKLPAGTIDLPTVIVNCADQLLHGKPAFPQNISSQSEQLLAGDPSSHNQVFKLETIVQILRNLKAFSEGQFDFFAQGFRWDNPQENIPKLHPEVAADIPRIDHTPEFVVASIIKQTSADLTILQNAAEQRLLAFKDYPEANTTLAQKTRKKESVQSTDGRGPLDFWVSDEIASTWLWNRSPLGRGSGDVITYLTDSIRVRVMPYSKVALVAIPYHWYSTKQGLYAIAHEVGHLRYWLPFATTKDELELFGRKTTAGLNIPKPGTPAETDRSKTATPAEEFVLCARELYYPFGTAPLKPTWEEEIFADVYGVWSAGEQSIHTGMEVSIAHSIKELTSFNILDSHPSPLIRPLLLIKALERIKRPLVLGGNLLPEPPSISDFLDPNAPLPPPLTSTALFEKWKGWLIDKGILHQVMVPDASPPFSEPHLPEFVDPRVGAAVAQLVDWNSLALNRNYVAERLVEDALIVLNNLLTEEARIESYNSKQTNQSKKLKRTPTFMDDPVHLWQRWLKTKGYFESPETLKEQEIYAGDFDQVMDPRTRGTNTWLPVSGSGGWNTEGACGSPGKPYE